MEITWTGGSQQDREAVANQYERYREANNVIDWTALETILSKDVTFFNLNGHTYNGKDHWTRLWQYYIKHIKSGPGYGFDAVGYISGDLAYISCHRKSRLDAVTDSKSATSWKHLAKEYVTRATVVFSRESEGWRVVHAHFSDGSDSERPGGI